MVERTLDQVKKMVDRDTDGLLREQVELMRMTGDAISMLSSIKESLKDDPDSTGVLVDDLNNTLASVIFKLDTMGQSIRMLRGSVSDDSDDTAKDDSGHPVIKRTLPTLAEASVQAHPEYDQFDDVIVDHEPNIERITEYTREISYSYTDPDTGKEKVGKLPVYPKFSELMNVDHPWQITMADVWRRFDPERYKENMAKDALKEKLSVAFSYLMENSPAMERKITPDEKEYCKATYDVSIDQYEHVGDLAGEIGFDMPDMAEIGGYTYHPDDIPVEMSGILAGIPDSIKKLAGI